MLGSLVRKLVEQTIPTEFFPDVIFYSPSNGARSSGINVLGFLVVLHLELYFYVQNEAIETRILGIKKRTPYFEGNERKITPGGGAQKYMYSFFGHSTTDPVSSRS